MSGIGIKLRTFRKCELIFKKVNVRMLYVGTFRNNTKYKIRGPGFGASHVEQRYHFQNLKGKC